MVRASDTRYGILELVQLTGIPRRTIRYYVQRGLLEAPLGSGRGHYYTNSHLDRLRQVRDLQEQGLTLEEVRQRLQRRSRGREAAPLPPLDLVTRIGVAPGVEVLISHGARPPSSAQLRDLAAAAAEILRPEEGDD